MPCTFFGPISRLPEDTCRDCRNHVARTSVWLLAPPSSASEEGTILPNGELAFLSPLFGFAGVIAGSVTSSASSRRQQQLDANKALHEQRVEIYEAMLVDMDRNVRAQEEYIVRGMSRRPAQSKQEADDEAKGE
jgi:hypothetical protein